jgi:hypothetical protein
MTHTNENRTARFELVLRPSEKEALTRLAHRRGRSIAAEMRAALDVWIEMHGDASWLDVEGSVET